MNEAGLIPEICLMSRQFLEHLRHLATGNRCTREQGGQQDGDDRDPAPSKGFVRQLAVQRW
jgi:hypothetical protein